MSKNSIYNTEYEMELRLLMVLYLTPFELMNEEQLFCYDFINCYGKEYEVSNFNLHGNSKFKFGEVAARKKLVSEAIKKLVLKGFAFPVQEKGFRYKITDNGINYLDSLKNSYCVTYMDIAKRSFDLFQIDSDEAKKFILDITLKGGRTNA